ncbi:MAG: DUF2341 domain-containing protein, partial [Candidatus Bathyarchaeia archaeon]
MKLKRSLFSAIFSAVVLFAFVADFMPFQIPEVHGELNPLPGWVYRKKHDMVGASSAGIGYQVKFRVYRGTGTDSANTVYLNGKCQEDFDDIRFTDAQGNIFNYWVQAKTTDYADIWVNVGVDLSINQTIYIYYGNPNAQSISDFDATFIFGETWESPDLNTSKWTVEAGAVTIDKDQRYVSLSAGGAMRSTRMNIVFPANFRVERAINDEGARIVASSSASGWGIAAFSITDRAYAEADGSRGIVWFGCQRYYYSYSPAGYYFRRTCGIGHNIDYYGSDREGTSYLEWAAYLRRQGDTYMVEGIRTETYTSSEPNRVYFATHSNAGTAKLWDFKIRKYVSPEPSHGEWYTEEILESFKGAVNVNIEPSWLPNVAFKIDQTTQYTPYSAELEVGSHNLTVVDDRLVINATHTYTFKCWKRDGTLYSYDKSVEFTLAQGQSINFIIVYTSYEITVVSNPEVNADFECGGWELTTPTTIYRGPGIHTFQIKTLTKYYNSTHMVKFFGWFLNDIFITTSETANIYIQSNSTLKIVYTLTETPQAPPMTFRAQLITLGDVSPGTTKDFVITVLFDQNAITITKIEFQLKQEWFTLQEPLPKQASRGMETIGTATIQAQLKTPENVQGYYSIPFIVTATTPQDLTITTASYITFTITATPQTSETTLTAGGFIETIQRLLGNPILLLLLIALIIWLASYS